MSIKTSIIVNSRVILFEVEERLVAGTSYNKIGLFFKRQLTPILIVNYRQLDVFVLKFIKVVPSILIISLV